MKRYILKVKKEGILLELPNGIIKRTPINMTINEKDVNLYKTFLKIHNLKYTLEELSESAVLIQPGFDTSHPIDRSIKKQSTKDLSINLNIKGVK